MWIQIQQIFPLFNKFHFDWLQPRGISRGKERLALLCLFVRNFDKPNSFLGKLIICRNQNVTNRRHVGFSITKTCFQDRIPVMWLRSTSKNLTQMRIIIRERSITEPWDSCSEYGIIIPIIKLSTITRPQVVCSLLLIVSYLVVRLNYVLSLSLDLMILERNYSKLKR